MKKVTTIFVSLFFLFHICSAQALESGNNIESIKRSYIGKEIKLTTQEAKFFWPLYSNYTSEVNNAKKIAGNNVIVFDENVLAIKKRYQLEFRKILGSYARANLVFLYEKKFRDILRRELQKRRMLNSNS